MTWGISGHAFLLLYGGLCMTILVVAKGMWLRALGPEPPDPDPRRLDVYEAAMVGGGHQLAITAAATKLHSDGCLRQGSAGASSLAVAGELARDAHPLERDVFEAVRRTPDISTAQLRRELDDSPAIDALLTRLTDEGLVVDEPAYRGYRRLWIAGALLVAFGAARLIAVWVGGHEASVYYLVALTGAAALGTSVVLRRDPIATRRGRALVSEQRERHEFLRASPSTGDAVLAVALFGGAALWLADPAIASVLEVPREESQLWGGRNESCSSGGGGGCGGGCGGGGCGGCGGCGG